jgi:arylsulfatase A-like enzyme/Flp pilus assembly protein TadD
MKLRAMTISATPAMVRSPSAAVLLLALAVAVACRSSSNPGQASARNLLIVTIDTLRADHVGAYGYARARTPALDSIARAGVLFERAYASAPITLTSHATILTGRYPPGHGARDNGQRVSASATTLASVLHAQGFRTAAFVAAFPLDHQFGLDRGFDVYSDRLPRDAAGRQTNERPASQVTDEAITWLDSAAPQQSEAGHRFFLWTHFFEPHAPYEGDTARPVLERYDDEIATVDREIGRLLRALGPRALDTIVVVAGDHGEAFGEHGEFAHSIFVYDTTLRVPLLIARPGQPPRRVADAVTLADIAPTAVRLLGLDLKDVKDVDGIDLSPALAGQGLPKRELYAESFAPLVEFGWAPLRSVRSERWKYIAAPKPELYDLEHDAGELNDVQSTSVSIARGLEARVRHYSSDTLASTADPGREAAERLRALGYSAGSQRNTLDARPDPKDRRELAARIAQVTSGELSGAALSSALEGIVRDDPRNGQAHLRLGFARLQEGDCRRAEPELKAAIASALRPADAYLGLASCLGQRHDLAGAESALMEARRVEPDNPVIVANLGILRAEQGRLPEAIDALRAALAADTNLHQARFNLAIALAKAGRRAEAAAAARELLTRLPHDAPQRGEVERLLKAVQ